MMIGRRPSARSRKQKKVKTSLQGSKDLVPGIAKKQRRKIARNKRKRKEEDHNQVNHHIRVKITIISSND
jgi:hypothetical protein